MQQDVLTEPQKEELGKKIVDIVTGLVEQGSWCNAAKVGTALNKSGISYQAYGFKRLKSFLNVFSDYLDSRDAPSPTKGAPAILEIRVKTAMKEAQGEPIQTIKPIDWAKEHGVKSDFVMKLLRDNGVKVLTQVSKVNASEFEKIEEAVAAEKQKQDACSKNLKTPSSAESESAPAEKTAETSVASKSAAPAPAPHAAPMKAHVFKPDAAILARLKAREQNYVKNYDHTIEQGKLVNGKISQVNEQEVLIDVNYKSEGVIDRAEFKDTDSLEIGSEIEVFVEKLEDEDGRLILSKQKADFVRVWDRIHAAFENNEVVRGKLTKRIKGGVVVDLFGIDAFLPNSYLDVCWVSDVDALIGQEEDLKVIEVDKVRRNIVVSRRAILEEERNKQQGGILKNFTDNNSHNETAKSKPIFKTGTYKAETPNLFMDWAVIPPKDIEDLAENKAIKEKWYFGEAEPEQYKDKYRILCNYLNHTFGKLYADGKVLSQKDEKGETYQAFNTGLVDKKYEYIYALFKTNYHQDEREKRPWHLVEFCTAGSASSIAGGKKTGSGKKLMCLFNPLPPRADYFKGSLKEVLYEPKSGDFASDYDHILIENCDRLPAQIFEIAPVKKDFTVINGISFREAQKLDSKSVERLNYFNTFKEKLMAEENENICRYITFRFQEAVRIAKKRAEWNYKTAIPMYFPTLRIMSFLLPLCLVEEGCVDCALVVEKLPNGNYQGQTILPLEWAYSNSRLIAKPESDWLNTNNISGLSENGEDDSSED